MAATINILCDDEIIERKRKTGKTHEVIYMRGLVEIEAETKNPDNPVGQENIR